MVPLIFVLASLILLAAFVALTRYESDRGVRVCASWRARFDQNVTQACFVLAHVDYGAFIRDELQKAFNEIGHVITHSTLRFVRIVERALTRLVRHFRAKSEQRAVVKPSRENAREFVRKLSDFKGELKATESDISDIQ